MTAEQVVNMLQHYTGMTDKMTLEACKKAVAYLEGKV